MRNIPTILIFIVIQDYLRERVLEEQHMQTITSDDKDKHLPDDVVSTCGCGLVNLWLLMFRLKVSRIGWPGDCQ